MGSSDTSWFRDLQKLKGRKAPEMGAKPHCQQAEGSGGLSPVKTQPYLASNLTRSVFTLCRKNPSSN